MFSSLVCENRARFKLKTNKTMDIKGKIHCFFERSGTFKNEFKKLGFEADDYDIQNEFSC